MIDDNADVGCPQTPTGLCLPVANSDCALILTECGGVAEEVQLVGAEADTRVNKKKSSKNAKKY